MSVAICEQDRARASWLEPDAWEIERAASWEIAPGEMALRFGETGLQHLAPAPSERWTGCTLEERALEWLEAHRAIYFITDEDVQLSVAHREANQVQIEQTWRGVRVMGTSLRLSWDEPRSRFSQVAGSLISASQMPETEVPTIDAAEALRRIPPVAASPILVVWPELTGRARLVWAVHDPRSNDRYVIDAMSGEVQVTHCDATELCAI